MSANPQDMQQMLAMYKSLYGDPKMRALDQIQGSLAQGAPAGTNAMSGGINGAAQLIAALMKSHKQKQLQQQLNNSQTANQQVVPMYPDQGQTTSAPSSTPVGTLNNPGGAF